MLKVLKFFFFQDFLHKKQKTVDDQRLITHVTRWWTKDIWRSCQTKVGFRDDFIGVVVVVLLFCSSVAQFNSALLEGWLATHCCLDHSEVRPKLSFALVWRFLTCQEQNSLPPICWVLRYVPTCEFHLFFDQFFAHQDAPIKDWVKLAVHRQIFQVGHRETWILHIRLV